MAGIVGCSHTLVNDEDPFGRRKEGSQTKETKLAAKRATSAPAGGGPAYVPPDKDAPTKEVVQIIKKTTGQPDHTYDPKDVSADKALDTFVAEKKKAGAVVNPADYVVKVATVPDKPMVSGPPMFDWAGVDSSIGFVVRGFNAMADMYGLKTTAEYKQAFADLDKVCVYFKVMKEKYGAKKK